MWSIIKDILTSPSGSFAFVFGILCAIGWGIHAITKTITLMSEKMKNVDKLENNIDAIKSDIQVIKANISVIQTGKASLIRSNSPIGLTDEGKKTAAELHVADMIARNWNNISALIEKNTSKKNAYDIQQFCIDNATVNMESLFLPDDLDKIKSFAYQNGSPLAYYSGMIGVLIRDKYFQTKGIDIAEVDKCKPDTL